MGKLAKLYANCGMEQTVEHRLPETQITLNFLRPNPTQIRAIGEFQRTLEETDERGDYKAAAKILKNLCVELEKDNEGDILKELADYPVADVRSIYFFYLQRLLGVNEDQAKLASSFR